MSTREKKICDAAHELIGGGPPSSSARARVDGVRAKVHKLLAVSGDKVETTLSSDSEKTLKNVRQGGGQ